MNRGTAEIELAADYDRGAEQWRLGTHSAYRQYGRALLAAVPLRLAGARVLDLGAGTGAMTAALRRIGAIPLAVDASPLMLREGLRVVAGLRAVASDATLLALRDACFDATFAVFLLNHLPCPHRALQEAARVTRRGGAVVAATFASGPPEPLKAVVEQVAVLSWGWDPPPWYSRQLRWAGLTGTTQGMAREATMAHLVAIGVSSLEVDLGWMDLETAVNMRLGHAHMVGLTSRLTPHDRRRFLAEVASGLGEGRQRVLRRLIVLSSQAPDS